MRCPGRAGRTGAGRRVAGRAAGVALLTLAAVAAPGAADPASAGSFPGGNGTIAFVSLGEHGGDVLGVEPDGSRLRPLVDSPRDTTSAFSDWSPGGARLAFDSDRSGNVEIYLRSPGGVITRLTSDPARDVNPAWAPGGGRIAFGSDRSGRPQVHLMDADGTGVRQVTHLADGAAEPSWSPTGDWIAFQSGPPRRSALFVVHPDGTGLRRLTPPGLDAAHASWSPDGRVLVFNSHFLTTDSRLFTVTLSGRLRQLLHSPAGTEDYEPAFSPDGRFVAFSSFRDGVTDSHIWVVRADGTGRHDLTPTAPGFNRSPTWAARS